MRFEEVSEHERRDIAVASSEAAAEFIATTLAVHGIQAATALVDRAYPSLSWVEGFRVVVAAEDEAVARRILADLSRADVVEVFPPDDAP